MTERFVMKPYEGKYSLNALEMIPLIKTRWWVITGGTGEGKTTILEDLALLTSHKGIDCFFVGEVARTVIDEIMAEGKTLEEIREGLRELKFQGLIAMRKYKIEALLNPNRLGFLDRGLGGDDFAYQDFAKEKLRIDPYDTETIVPIKHRYAGIFLPDFVPYEKDYARTESEEDRRRLHEASGFWYHYMGYDVIRVPLFSLKEEVSRKARAQFILDYALSHS